MGPQRLDPSPPSLLLAWPSKPSLSAPRGPLKLSYEMCPEMKWGRNTGQQGQEVLWRHHGELSEPLRPRAGTSPPLGSPFSSGTR